MNNRPILVLAAVLAFSPVARAQNAAPGGRGRGGNAAAPVPGPAHDPHDLSGVWRSTFRNLTVSNETPPMTPLGQQKFNANKPSYGVRAIPPALGNDPQGNCDPLGIPRLLFYGGTSAIEFLQAPDRVVQFFEWMHVWRTIWTDGRPLPEDPDPTWLGYSVGKWEGDTFIVDSVGFNDRTWLDHFGSPHSDQMRLQERYKRLDRDNLQLTLTLADPTIYSKPWVSDVKTFRFEPKTQLQDLTCVPSDEQAFNKRVRDVAGGKTGK